MANVQDNDKVNIVKSFVHNHGEISKKKSNNNRSIQNKTTGKKYTMLNSPMY